MAKNAAGIIAIIGLSACTMYATYLRGGSVDPMFVGGIIIYYILTRFPWNK